MRKIHLGKTRDSRTRKRAGKVVNTEEQEKLAIELKGQKEFVGYLLLKGFSTSTTKRYVQDASIFIQWAAKENVPIEQVAYTDVLHYIQSKKKNNAQTTVSKKINSLKHYFNYLSINNESVENPTRQIQLKGIKRKKLYEILSKKELESLYNNFEIASSSSKNKNQNWFKASQLASKRNQIMLGLMIYQGLSANELSNITQTDLKLREGKVYIAGTRKSNERTLKLEPHQIMGMMEYTSQIRKELVTLSNKNTDKLIISVGQGTGISNMMAKMLQKLNKQNSKVTSIQQIRTSVITHWLKHYNLREVQYMAGHRYVSSTEGYLVNDLDDLQEDISKYHPIG